VGRLIVISGCSGGGKSTLLAELGRRGHAIVEEPGRRIVRAGGPLPWDDPEGFARRAVDVALADLAQAEWPGWTFFDRGLIDAAAALEHATGEAVPSALRSPLRYDEQMFLAPPWPEIYVADAERRHDFASAEAEYGRLVEAYRSLGYRISILPKANVETRADFVEALLAKTE